jgi:hypothetical protein
MFSARYEISLKIQFRFLLIFKEFNCPHWCSTQLYRQQPTRRLRICFIYPWSPLFQPLIIVTKLGIIFFSSDFFISSPFRLNILNVLFKIIIIWFHGSEFLPRNCGSAGQAIFCFVWKLSLYRFHKVPLMDPKSEEYSLRFNTYIF